MMYGDYLTLLGVVGLLVLAGLALAATRALRTTGGDPPEVENRSAYLFENDEMVDVAERVDLLPDKAGIDGSGLGDFYRRFSAAFPGLAARLRANQVNELPLTSLDGQSSLAASAVGTRMRIFVGAADQGDDPAHAELDTLRAVADSFPYLAWRQDPDDRILWANRAYHIASGTFSIKDAPPALFGDALLKGLAEDGFARRIKPATSDPDSAGFYECRGIAIGPDRLFFAVPIDAMVQAEHQLRDFMQTLTRTFSHLSTGLAVFDRKRRLVLFNPALTELSGLPVEFLAARPTLYAFLDRLRDKRLIPEPRDYGAWRRQISDLESAAMDGTYSETWSLPNSRTYRMTGRPHHGGALALMIEDISTEMSLTRRFRREVELYQGVIDAMDTAAAVFSSSGVLTMTNRAYRDLWGADIDEAGTVPTIAETVHHWMKVAPSPAWRDASERVLGGKGQGDWSHVMALKSGAEVTCRMVTVGGDSTLVTFQNTDDVTALPEVRRANA